VVGSVEEEKGGDRGLEHVCSPSSPFPERQEIRGEYGGCSQVLLSTPAPLLVLEQFLPLFFFSSSSFLYTSLDSRRVVCVSVEGLSLPASSHSRLGSRLALTRLLQLPLTQYHFLVGIWDPLAETGIVNANFLLS